MDAVADERCVAVYWLCTGTHEYDFYGRCSDGTKILRLRNEFLLFKGRGKIANDVAAEGMIDTLRVIGACDK